MLSSILLQSTSLPHPLHCSLARQEPLLREKAITRWCENWEIKPKLSLEFVGSSGAFCFLLTSAFEIVKWWCRRKLRTSNNRFRPLWRFMQISHESFYVMNSHGALCSNLSLPICVSLAEWFIFFLFVHCGLKFQFKNCDQNCLTYFSPAGHLEAKGHVHGELLWSVLFYFSTYA